MTLFHLLDRLLVPALLLFAGTVTYHAGTGGAPLRGAPSTLTEQLRHRAVALDSAHPDQVAKGAAVALFGAADVIDRQEQALSSAEAVFRRVGILLGIVGVILLLEALVRWHKSRQAS